MKSVITLGLIVSFWTACSASAGPATPSLENPIVIEGLISRGTMSPIMKYLTAAVSSKTVPNEVTLILNSPGGEINVGSQFIYLMRSAQAQGTKFTCVVHNLAASMAFSILLACDKRVTNNHALLLWHRARVGGVGQGGLTGPAALNLGQELVSHDEDIMVEIKKAFDSAIPDDQLQFHFEMETFHLGSTLSRRAPKFITAMDVIPGLVEVVNDKNVLRTADVSILEALFGKKKEVKPYLMYIMDKYAPDLDKLISIGG